MKERVGYFAELAEKDGIFGEIGESKTVFCTQEKLIDLLHHRNKYVVWNCRWVNLNYYFEHNLDVGVEIME